MAKATSRSRRSGSSLSALRDKTTSTSNSLAEILAQAQAQQEALRETEEQLAALELEQAEKLEELEGSLTIERDEALEEAAELRAKVDAGARDLKAAVKALAGLATQLTKCPDPLDPLSDDDTDRDLKDLRQQLDDLVDRRGTFPSNLSGLGEAVAAAAELADCLVGRIKLQSGRLKLAQNHVSELEREVETLQAQCDHLREVNDDAEAAIDQTLTDMDQVSHQITSLHDALVQAEATIAAKDAEASAAAARTVTDHAELEEQIEVGKARAEELEKMLQEAKDLAHKAEHAGAELAEVVVHLCDAEIGQGEPCPMPNLSARDELATLASDAGEDWADEVDELFRQDLGEDLVAATKVVTEALLKRRKAIIDALEHERVRAGDLEARCTDQAAQITDLSQRLNEAEQDLSRTKAELDTTVEELESTAAELSEKHKELTETKGELAQANAELDDLRDQAVLAKSLKSELGATQKDLGKVSRKIEAADTLRIEASKAQNALAQALVELATATDAALSAGNLKGTGGQVSRFTKSFKKLDDVVQHSDGDLLRLIRNSGDVVDKVTNRVEHIAVELRERGDKINDNNRRLIELEKMNTQASVSLDEQEQTLKELTLQTAELSQVSKRADGLETQLETKLADLAAAKEELEELRDSYRQASAELEELRAREEEITESSEAEVAELKRRLSDEQNAKRQIESDLGDEREELAAQVATLEARYAELEGSLDERDAQIAELQSELDEAADLQALLKEAQSHVRELTKDLDDERARTRDLEGQLADQAESESLAAELKDLAGERDALQKKVRDAEKRLANDAGTIASLKTTNDSLSRKLDDRSAKYREEIEQLAAKLQEAKEENSRFKKTNAGLNARVRTLTAS